jgi:UDP-N-acetylmuramyl pentapeptide phosphotransferase/UDP-N-acetylglucosamine-1-phosphate transferase
MPFLLALAVGLVLTPLLALVGRRVGLVDHPTGDALKIHGEPKPLTGGLAVVPAALVSLAIFGDGLDPLVAAAVLLLLGVGVVDDARSLPQLIRLGAQLAAGIALAVSGATIEPLGAVGPAALVLAVPATANAVNMVDGQDGLAAGLAAAAALGMTLILASASDPGSLGPALLGALVGFLVWNRPPASVFLGDGGAYAVGGLLVVLASDAAVSWASLIGVTVCFGVLALELGSSVVRRAIRRESLIGGDRAHGYDLLAVRLSSRTRATAVVVTAGLLLAGFGWAASRLPVPAAAAILIATVLVGCVAILALWRPLRDGVRRSR